MNFSIWANICDEEIAINYNTNTITIAIAKNERFSKASSHSAVFFLMILKPTFLI